MKQFFLFDKNRLSTKNPIHRNFVAIAAGRKLLS
jgi:hypothetical protein